ncbi:hypothetical protein GCM10007973_08950 [Polymorphobacter multimanifer]|uniref:DUF2178 domain-containing protein n=1 Tax=Polymorphobacter multimanifer TaxID=1070431 RepID=A0A841L7R9_9SPHN|nr:hypothetical protein [Polymorphobacter multimanifer]MBB6225905.1 hypothetical protein [Polymorphobacter multimanifer]GGI74342.1 hypothetical protein GCM10007973_08950 [Polymorphobacter multimanifer]
MTQTGTISMSARTARRLSVLVLGALTASYLIDLTNPALPRAIDITLGIVKIMSLLGAILLFLGSHGQQAQASDAMLDERQRAERDRAFVLTHQIMVGVLLASMVYLEIGGKIGMWLPEVPDIVEILTVFVLVSMALPGMILAFRDRSEELGSD